MTVNYCTKHRAFLPVEKFSRDKTRPNGLTSWCKDCLNASARELRKSKIAGVVVPASDDLGRRMIGVDAFSQVLWDSTDSVEALAAELGISIRNANACIGMHAVKLWAKERGYAVGPLMPATVAAAIAKATRRRVTARELAPYVGKTRQWVQMVRCGQLHRKVEPADLPERWVDKCSQDCYSCAW